MSFITAESIFKSYATTQALMDISFNVEKNELFGFIGPDGAGKTSLFRIIATLLLANKGSLTIKDWDVVKDYRTIRKNIGYMPGKFSLYQDLSVEENLNFFATIFGTTIQENYDLIKEIYIQIEPFKKRLAGQLSGGMKQKLALSCALIHKPELLVLDEPTTGVDAVSRKEFWEMLKSLRNKGITIVVSTPYMDEAGLCDRVALMQSGKIMQVDTPQGIVNKFPKRLFGIKTSNMYKLKDDLQHYAECHSIHLFGQFLHFTGISSEITRTEIDGYIRSKGHNNIMIEEIKPGIEDCFIALMTENTVVHEK